MNKSVLIVDDDDSILDMMSSILKLHEFTPVICNSPKKACELIKEQIFHVMFFDLQMPEITGIELCQIARQTNKLTFIYAITGSRTLFEISECREAGFDDYFTKPLDMKLITQKVKDTFTTIERWAAK